MAAKSAIIARSSSYPDSRLLSSLFLEAKVLVSELEPLIDLAFQHVTLASLYFFFGHHGLIFYLGFGLLVALSLVGEKTSQD